RWGDVLVGIKQRVHGEVTGPFGLRSLEQASKTAAQLRSEGFRCRLMVHFGSLAAGMPADVAVFRVEQRPCHLDDLYGGSRTLERLVVPMATVKAGAVVFQQIYLP